MELNVDGDGFLKVMSDWTPDVMHELAAQDGVTLNDEWKSFVDMINTIDKMVDENQEKSGESI